MEYVFGLVDFSVRRIENLMSYPVLYSAVTYTTLLADRFRNQREFCSITSRTALLRYAW